MLEFREASGEEDIKACHSLEVASYPASEAASLEKFLFRYEKFSSLFRLAVQNGEIIGFICSTRCKEFTEETMDKEYDLDGKILAIHSVCIDKSHRRNGFATKMMNNYLCSIRRIIKDFDRFELICKPIYLGLYTKCGFICHSMSTLQHGGNEWLYCSVDRLSRKYFIVDAFTNQKGKGNPAAVVFCDGYEDEGYMQLIAAEFNLSETVFIFTESEETHTYKLFFYTPTAKIIFCGHATLAASKVLLSLNAQVNKLNFRLDDNSEISATRSGLSEILLNFPVHKTKTLENNDGKKDIFKVFKKAMSFEESDILYIGAHKEKILLEVTTESYERLFAFDIDFTALKSDISYDLIIVSTRKLKENEIKYEKAAFYSRVFAPKIGINEDPVTGSAHCLLFPYYLKESNDEDEIKIAIQTSSRSGKFKGCVKNNRVLLYVEANIVAEGFLKI